MKVKKRLRCVTNRKKQCKKDMAERNDLIHNFMVVTGCAVLAVGIAVVPKLAGSGERDQVYAASGLEDAGTAVSSESSRFEGDYLPTGIAGVVTGIAETPSVGSSVKRIGTSCEKVMVGQRIKRVEHNSDDLNVHSSMENSVNSFDAAAVSMAENPKMMSDGDYDTLLHIVEAEAGGEDVKGRVLVANVIMNRVKSEEFPNTVTDVVWDYSDGVPQFSPTYDGRISEVTVSDDTREAVKQALEGVDYSEGALFFVEKATADKKNVAWFDRELKRLFRYGVHDFYTYPDEEDEKETSENRGDSETEADDNIVQMVKK